MQFIRLYRRTSRYIAEIYMQCKECITYTSKVKHFESQMKFASSCAIRCSYNIIIL